MKRLIKRILKSIYGRTEFLRTPIRAELQSTLKVCVDHSFDEVRVVLEDLVREVYRLQNEVASLKSEVSRLGGAEDERAAA